MKNIVKVFYFSAALALLAGCSDDSTTEVSPDAGSDSAEVEEQVDVAETETDEEAQADEEESEEASEAEESTETETSPLDAYSSEEIEYARVWLELGANQDIDGLYVTEFEAGTPLNPDDETSAVYPVNVIQLAGSRLVDGSVTYSSNGDGTINRYNVPLRWDGEYPAGTDFYNEFLAEAELISIPAGENDEVIRLIELLETES